MQAIARVSLIISGLCSRWMGVTDTYKWLRVIVNNTLIGHVEMMQILWPSNIPDWRRYTLLMASRLAIGKSGRDLRRVRH